MNNSAARQLIRSKGFAAANMGTGDVALIKPDVNRVIRLTDDVVGWLQALPDVVNVEEGFVGYYPGDQVQVLHYVANYAFWGLMATIHKVVMTKKYKLLVILRTNDTMQYATVPATDVIVFDRPGAIVLTGKTPEQREAILARIQSGELEVPTKLPPMPLMCECKPHEPNHPNWQIDAEDEWLKLNTLRGDNGLVEHQFILSKDCPEVEKYHVVASTARLVLVEALHQ